MFTFKSSSLHTFLNTPHWIEDQAKILNIQNRIDRNECSCFCFRVTFRFWVHVFRFQKKKKEGPNSIVEEHPETGH